MILLADSGSTKTDWALVRENGAIARQFRTEGMNPVLLADEEISSLLHAQLCPQLEGVAPERIYYYGAGCRPDQCQRMASLLSYATGCVNVEVASDLLGACRALSGSEAGICCILGTGSASCYYDGDKVALQTPSLGYILGDEGSGTSLGKHFLADCLKGLLPEDVQNAFVGEYGIDVSGVIDRVYRQPLPNRYMAGFVPFLHKYKNEEKVRAIIIEEFSRFVERNLLIYYSSIPGCDEAEAKKSLPVHFVGSVAHYFKSELEEVLSDYGLTLGRIEQAPLRRLASYHADM